MISRDTSAHLLAVIVAIGVLLVAGYANVPTDSALEVALLVAVYGIAFGGAHLYLALRHDDGLVPVESRWRYLTALSIVILSAATIGLLGDQAVGPTTVETIGLGVIAITAAGYLLIESADGYRASRA